MQTHDLIQGTPEWHAHRATHFNASDAPAMMGCSPYKTRTQLLQELHTGMSAEVDAETQRRFDDGHRFEALARPLAEKIIGEDLYPVTGSDGLYSASFDGLTMDECTGFEHKSLNGDLRECMEGEDEAPRLPLHYRVQMEQQCMVSGAERILFMASKWNGDELVEERHCWYYPDDALRAQIVAGWAQFKQDLKNFQPQVSDVKPSGKAPETLPALRIEISGQVQASNLGEFKAQALAVFGAINRDLKTDQDFADAEKTVKWCGDVEERLEAAKQHALSQTASIDELFRAIDDISAEARRVRLDLDKLVKARKEAIRAEIVQRGQKALAEHIAALNQRLGKPYMPAVLADFAGAIKGKKTVESLNDAVDTTLAKAKIEASAIADRIQINLEHLREHAIEYASLFPDTAQIVQKAPDDLATLVKARIADHQAADEEKARKLAEEATRAAAVSVSAPAAQPAPVVPLRAAKFDEPTTGALMKLGAINERLAPLSITADGLAQLGFKHVKTEGASKLYRESDFSLICDALIQHLNQASDLQLA
jgi:putative phage-type endonuclease